MIKTIRRKAYGFRDTGYFYPYVYKSLKNVKSKKCKEHIFHKTQDIVS